MSTAQPQLQPVHARKRSRLRLLTRMMIGCLIVVAAVAATIATGTLLEVKAFTDALKQSPRLNLGSELASANAGPADASADRLGQESEGRDRRRWPPALGHDASRPA